MCGAAPIKYKKGQVVYLRSVVTEIGECGQPAVRIEQPGGYALVVPDEKQIYFKSSEEDTVRVVTLRRSAD